MSSRTIEGVVENGRIRLKDAVMLPENTRVLVIVADTKTEKVPQIHSPRLARPEQAADFRKQCLDTDVNV